MSDSNDTTVRSDHVVTISYQFTDTGGADHEDMDQRQTVTYLHGHGQLLPGLESALEGMEAKQTADVTLEPEGAFGPHHDELVIQVERERLTFDVAEGDVVRAELPDGQQQHLQVVEVGDETVTLDGNHPLAGRTLGVNVTVDQVREATSEEVANGQAAQPEEGEGEGEVQ
jgi:FKBP-type peptidyl-prolyl cis-trans isomerase SlyD